MRRDLEDGFKKGCTRLGAVAAYSLTDSLFWVGGIITMGGIICSLGGIIFMGGIIFSPIKTGGIISDPLLRI